MVETEHTLTPGYGACMYAAIQLDILSVSSKQGAPELPNNALIQACNRKLVGDAGCGVN